MQELVSIFLIGVSLSMDTFSLSLSMGTLIKNKKFLTLFPFVVALFHFIMPLIGNKIGITTILVNPISNIDETETWLNRQIEKKIFKIFEQKKLLIKGKYYD